MHARCLKITEKVSFNIVREANYIYILSEQKFIKNAKKSFFAIFLKTEVYGQTVLPDRSVLIGQFGGKFKCDTLSNFQTVCSQRMSQQIL